MSQERLDLFLKRNRDKWFSVEQLASALKVNIHSVGSNLKKMEIRGELLTKPMSGIGYKQKKREFCYKPDDPYFDDVLKDFANKRLELTGLYNQQDILLLMLIAQNKRVIELLEGKKQ